MKTLVTGGAGFIGSHLAKRLVKDGHKVIVIDSLYEGKLENLKSIQNQIKFYKKDILDLDFLNQIFKGVNYVFHQAALRSVLRSVEKPLPSNKVNIEGTLNVLLAARDNKVKRVIFASSSSVYGEQKSKILKESLCPHPLSPYALSKLAGEIYLKQFFNLFGLETISLRYFNVFGPFQDPENEYAAVVPIFITKLLKNQSPTIHWDGKQSRDFSYIDNVVEANILAMRAKIIKGETINVCEGKTISINKLYMQIGKILKKKLKPKHSPKRDGDIRRTHGDIDFAKKVINFENKISFEKGLERTIDWFRSRI